MNRLLICTVGTSLLSGRERPWSWRPGAPLPDASTVMQWLRDADPEAASAETNTLVRLEPEPNDRIVLLHSDTEEGQFCAEMLAVHYRPQVRDVEVIRITQLGYGAKGFTRGLKAMVDIVCRKVRESARRSGESVILCATGGFKAEIAFLNLLGALLQLEVVYIHELHQELVTLPRLPLMWDVDFASANLAFFEWIEEEPRPAAEVESRLKQEPRLRDLVESGDDGNIYLSAAGHLLFRAAVERTVQGEPVSWPEPVPLPPEKKLEERLTFQNAAHKRPQGWQRYVAQICAVDCVALVGYTDDMKVGPRVKILDPEQGIIGLRYGERGDELPIRVHTTARGEAQCRLVAEYLRKLR